MEHSVPSPSRPGLILMDGGESGRVIGSCVTHPGVNDSDMSENQGNARSASRSTVSRRDRTSGLSRAGAAAGLFRSAFIIHVEDCDGFHNHSHSYCSEAKLAFILASAKKKKKSPIF